MKSTFILIGLFITLHTMGQTYNRVYEDWATFNNERTKDFSESFKIELSKQLKEQFDLTLSKPNACSDYDFLLNVGDSELKTIVQDKTVFALVNIIGPNAQQYTMTASWNSPDFEEPLMIQKSDITDKKVYFAWCIDFPKKELSDYFIPYKQVTKGENDFKFDLTISPYNFPDVAVELRFEDTPAQETLKKIEDEFLKFNEKYKKFYYGGLTKDFKRYYILLDFDTIDYSKYSDKDLYKDLDLFIELFKSINNNPEIKGINRVMVK